MDEAELKYLRAFAAKSAGATIRATVWADDTGALHAEAVNAAGGGKPRVVTRHRAVRNESLAFAGSFGARVEFVA